MSKHLSMLALVPSMLHTLCSPWEEFCCCCLPFLPFLIFPAFFGFVPSISFKMMLHRHSSFSFLIFPAFFGFVPSISFKMMLLRHSSFSFLI